MISVRFGSSVSTLARGARDRTNLDSELRLTPYLAAIDLYGSPAFSAASISARAGWVAIVDALPWFAIS